ITSSHSSTIDNVFTNYGIGGCPKGILYSDVSDHLPIFLCIPLNAKAVGGKNPYIKTRLINSENLKKANCLLQNIQWNMSDYGWRIINEILGSKKSCNKLFSNDASETAKLSTVTGLNKFFVEIGKNINKILGDGQLISNVGPYVVSNNPIFIPRDTTPDEIVSVITSATRQHGMLMSKKVRTSTYDRSWVAKGVRLWNVLAMHNQLQLTIEHFKHYAKSEVMSMSVGV
ncbi:hypothetical protein HELRODRAFT_184487, partial [Helobdella robusta]